MNRHLLAALLTMMLPATPAAAQARTDLDAQLKLLMQWWPGDYDNNEQIVRQSGGGLGTPTRVPFFRLHSRFQNVRMPSLGNNVLYLEEYRDNDPSQIMRVRLYSLTIDETARAIRIKLHSPSDPATARTGYGRDPQAALEKLRPQDIRSFRDSCDLLLRFVGGQFEGGMTERGCDFEGQEWFQYQVVVGPRYHWVRDRRLSLKDQRVTWELAPGSDYRWFEQTKARWFSCNVNHNASGDMTQTKPLSIIELHDQGGEADIAWPDGRTLTFIIHTRAFTSPPDREFPLFRIHEKGKTVPIAYAYAIDDAERFGLNLGWFYILCRTR